MIRTGLGQYRVLQVSDAGFNAFDEAVVCPSVDILYQYEDLDNVGWAPQIPFVGVAPIPMQIWKLGGSNHLSYRGGSVTTFFSSGMGDSDSGHHRTHRWLLLSVDAPVHVRPDSLVGPDEPEHGRLDV